MPKRIARLLPFALAAGLAVGLLASCRSKEDAVYIEGGRATLSLREREEPKSIEELERGILAYKKEVQRTIKASENLGTYYRLLGVEYMNRQMYGEALGAFEEAVRLYPENEQLPYWAGVCAARMAKAMVADATERARFYALAEQLYQRTLFLYADHRPALFGLAVLYSIELGRPAQAVPLLERYLAKDTSNVEAMTLLARTHVALANYQEAIELYRAVSRSSTASAEVRQQAQENAAEVERRMTGGGQAR